MAADAESSPPADALEQPDGSFLQSLEDGASVSWSKRPDGSWRKPKRVKAGWVGELDRVGYKPPGARKSTSDDEGEDDDASSQDGPAMHDLEHKWCLWLQKRQGKQKAANGPTASWKANQQCIHEFGTVEDFWCMHKHSVTPSQLDHLDYSLFKKKLSPAWEDPAFKRGGRWMVQLEKLKAQNIDEVWLSLVLGLIGGELSDGDYDDIVAGGIVEVRNRTCKIALWLTEAADQEQILAIGRSYREVLCEAKGLNDVMYKEVTYEDFAENRHTLQLHGNRAKVLAPYTNESTVGIFQ